MGSETSLTNHFILNKDIFMKSMLHRLILLILFGGLTTGCQESFRHEAPSSPPGAPVMMKTLDATTELKASDGEEASPGVAPVDNRQAGGRSGPQGQFEALKNRKLIYTAHLQIEIQKYEESFEKVQALVKEFGGFVADLQVQENPDRKKSATIMIRVPEAAFENAVAKLKTVGELKSEQINGQDITEEYTDLEARLKNKRELENRLLEILRIKTGKLSDLLEVETELARVREEIDQLEGRKRFLDDRVSLSTITVNLFEPTSITSSSQWQPLRQALEDMTQIFAGSLGALLIFVSGALPWLILGGISLWVLVRVIKRRRAKRLAQRSLEVNRGKDEQKA